jgi:secreted trypsin-like serine protease
MSAKARHGLIAFFVLLLVPAFGCKDISHDSADSSPAPGCGKPDIWPKELIIGGNDAIIKSYPWQCSMQRKRADGSTRHICGASVLSSRYLLTAAHCGYINEEQIPPANLSVMCGGVDLAMLNNSAWQKRELTDFIVHKQYNSTENEHDYDIALIELKTELSINDFVRPICLPNISVEEVKCDKYVITGWGVNKTNGNYQTEKLQQLKVKQAKNCVDYYSSRNITANMICVRSKRGGGPCKGDSGGPVICEDSQQKSWIQYGIAAFGPTTCTYGGLKWKPSVYIGVSVFLPWIHENTKYTLSCSLSDKQRHEEL